MRKTFFLSIVSLLYLSSSAICSKTDLIIRAQDDETEGGLKLNISIHQRIEDGPTGDNIEIVKNGSGFAIKDNDENFLTYNVDQKGSVVPRLLVTELRGQTRGWHPEEASIIVTTPEGKVKKISLSIDKDKKGIYFAKYDGLTYDIPYHINALNLSYPFVLEPRDSEGNPLPYKSVDQTSLFDAVSTFGTVWSVFNMYEQDLTFLDNKKALSKWTNRGKVKVFPHMTEEQFKKIYPYDTYQVYQKNAFYDYNNGEHVLCFFPITIGTYTSQSFDVVSHEAGHNALNILRTDLWKSPLSDLRAFHESFGDVTALVSVLRFPELREKILAKTKGNLHVPSFLSVIGEKIVDRDMTDYTKISVLPSCEEHELSERLTRALYGIFADFFNATRGDQSQNLDFILSNTSDKFRLTFLEATLSSKFKSLIDFGRVLREKAEKEPSLQFLVHVNFLRQGIDLTDSLLSPQLCILQEQDGETQSGSLGCSTGKVPVLNTNDFLNLIIK